MDQTKALTALQPFVHLAMTTKNPSPRFVADLITRATSSPNTYVFTELLQTPAIQSLRESTDFQMYFKQLEQFAWGTWADYQTDPTLPPLNEAQSLKLRQLTLLSLPTTPMPTTYDNLMKELSITSIPELETLITSAIYSSLLTARLSPASTPPTIHISSVAPLRDLRPASLPEMLKILQTWESRCASIVSELEQQIAAIKTDATTRRAKDMARQEIVDHAVLNVEGGGIGPAKGQQGGGKARDTETRKGKGVTSGNKRDLQEQQGSDGYGEDDGEDGGVGVGVAKMEVDEGGGAATMGKNEGPLRAPKRVFGKKG